MARVNLVGSVDRRVPVLYLDLDGTVRHGKTELGRFVNHASDVVVFPEVRRIWRQWRARAAMRDWDERFAFEILGAWPAQGPERYRLRSTRRHRRDGGDDHE